MTPIVYAELAPGDPLTLQTIDRSESINGVYRAADGVLTLDEAEEHASPWSEAALAEYTSRLRTLAASGGAVFAAHAGTRLVGIGSLDASGVGGDPTVMTLDMLYVSAECRGQGIGRTLTNMVAARARAAGAQALYISATPTRSTVDAYLRMGAHVLRCADPVLLAREPEDIHFRLPLR